MMGIIIIGLVEFVKKKRGSDGVDKLFERSDLTVASIRPEKIYTEETFQELLDNAIRVTGLSRDELEVEWAKFMVKLVQDKFPIFFERTRTARELLVQIPDIHFTVFPTIQGNQTQKITIKEYGPDYITYQYESPNNLCKFMKK